MSPRGLIAARATGGGARSTAATAATGVSVSATLPIANLVLATAFILAVSRSANADVSWLLTVGERWLGGERLYIDVIEVNPPASVLIYMPAILLARLLGCPSEVAVVALTVAGCAASLGLCTAILRRTGLGGDRGRLKVCGALALVSIIPTGTFAEREHAALLAALPWLAVLAARSEGRVPSLATAVLAGFGGGIALAIKPMFALGFAGPLLFVLSRRGWRSLATAWDLHAAWSVAGAYGVSVLLLFPAFVAGPLPWVLLAYVPARHSVLELMGLGVTILWICLLLCSALLWRQGRAGPLAQTAILASCGFGVVFLLQGKGWSYQALPAVLLAALACWLCLADAVRTVADLRALLPQALGCAVFLTMAAMLFDNQPSGARLPELAETIARLSPHPRMMAISSDIADGHPLVRELGGRWVGTFCSNWITAALANRRASLPPNDLDRLEALSDRERAIVLRDVAVGRPDVILLQDGRTWIDYVAGSPGLASALAAFRPAGHFGAVTLLVHRSHLEQERAP